MSVFPTEKEKREPVYCKGFFWGFLVGFTIGGSIVGAVFPRVAHAETSFKKIVACQHEASDNSADDDGSRVGDIKGIIDVPLPRKFEDDVRPVAIEAIMREIRRTSLVEITKVETPQVLAA